MTRSVSQGNFQDTPICPRQTALHCSDGGARDSFKVRRSIDRRWRYIPGWPHELETPARQASAQEDCPC
jgi:hypothetical protein